MITVANRATPAPKPLEQQEPAITNEGAPLEGQMPDPKPDASTASTARPTLHLPVTPQGEQGAGKA
ncbi:hypothetical protein [Hydrogenophaga sp. PAMC20947]|uniref:hypothetical protein n=1 Tax=Hydrogenophaga sp. PAMC20947 TaxID=2565558 RepID=UPI00109E2007|nr:hypothetical protein [Hydrogenophaga sp. PAMC20947]QCB45426.1 hypothetical protein E5678_04925 [Hydrogenophaga sp. PAMC20947]